VSIISSHVRKPDQYIQPWQFGHGETKKTGYWLKNLPLLKPTKVVEGRENRIWRLGPSKERWKQRSETLPGIAAAMAEQWGKQMWTKASATQLKTFRRCPSRWYAEKILGHTTPPTEAMERGRRIHSMLEAYLRDGTDIPDDDHGRMAHAALERLPDKGSIPADNVEQRFELHETVLGAPFVGVIDLVEDGRITDHKTTSDWKYQKSEEELRADPQAQTYALNYVLCSDEDKVTFRHVYIRTKGGPASRETSVELTRADLADAVVTIREDITRMRAASVVENMGEVQYNLEACGDYGGCPHRARCAALGRQTLGVVSSLFMDSRDRQMDTTDPLAALLASRRPINPPDGTPEMELPPAEVEAQQELADLEPEEVTNKRQVLRLTGVPGDDGQDVLITRASKGDLVTFAQLNKILVDPPAGRQKPGMREYRAAIEAFLNFVEEPIQEAPQETVEPTVAGTGTGWTQTPVPTIEAVMEKVKQVDDFTREAARIIGATPPVETPKVETRVVKKTNGETFVLYINACPRGPVTFLEDVLAPIAREVEEESGVPHYGMLQYNTGPKKVAAVLASRVRSGEVTLHGPVVADMRLPASEPSVEVLLSFATDVVRKF